MREGRATESAAAGRVDPALAGARRSSTHKRENTMYYHTLSLQCSTHVQSKRLRQVVCSQQHRWNGCTPLRIATS